MIHTPPTQIWFPEESVKLRLVSSGWTGYDWLPNSSVVLTSKSHGKVQTGPVAVTFVNWAPGRRE
jgi:hypothetical protein